MIDMSCKVANCINNDDLDCTVNSSIDEDGYCETKSIDDSRCSICGAEYIKTTINNNLEYFGTPCKEEGWRCANGCED